MLLNNSKVMLQGTHSHQHNFLNDPYQTPKNKMSAEFMNEIESLGFKANIPPEK